MTSTTPAIDLYQAAARQPAKLKQKNAGNLVNVQPKTAEELAGILTNPRDYPSPVRPVGSGSSVTRAAQTARGTLIDMTALNHILGSTSDSVTVQAGARLRDLAEYLAHDDMELVGGCTDPNRTVGGAISSGSLGARMPGDGAQLASSVLQITLINGEGRRVEVSEKLPDLLCLVRMSYGLLGIVYAVKLRIRPIRSYAISNSKVDFEEFVQLIPNLMEAKAAVRASLFAFRDKVNVELRYPGEGEQRSRALPWKLRDWATHAVMPRVVRSVNKAIPVKNLRGSLIDTVTEATHALNSFADIGSNASEQTGRFKRLVLENENSNCVWFFPVENFAAVIPAFRKFCLGHYKETGYRCDLPAEVWRVNQDQSSLLSPSFAAPCFALAISSTCDEGWDDHLLEFSEFAAHFRGVPVFNQTKGFKPGYASRVYGERLQRFCDMRSRLDPKSRLLNQYFAEHLR
jgi:hypothetical protein